MPIADTNYLPQVAADDELIGFADEQATSPVQACYSPPTGADDVLKLPNPDLAVRHFLLSCSHCFILPQPLHDERIIQENNFAHWIPEMEEATSRSPVSVSSVSPHPWTWSDAGDVDVATTNSGILPVLPASQIAPSEPVMDNFAPQWQHPLSQAAVLHSEQPAPIDTLTTFEPTGLGDMDFTFAQPLPAPQNTLLGPVGNSDLATPSALTFVPLAINPTLGAIMPLSNYVLDTSPMQPPMPSILQNNVAAIAETPRPTRSLPRRQNATTGSVGLPLPLPIISQRPTDEDTAAAKEYDEEAGWAEFDTMVEEAHRAENNEDALFDTAAMDRHRDSLPSSLFQSPLVAVQANPVLAPAEVAVLPSTCVDSLPTTPLASSQVSQEQPPLVAGNDEDNGSDTNAHLDEDEDEWAAFDQELEELMAVESENEDEDESPAVFDIDAMARHGFVLTPQGTLARSDSLSPPSIASYSESKPFASRGAKRGFSPEPVSAEIDTEDFSNDVVDGVPAGIKQTFLTQDNTIPPSESPPLQYQSSSISSSISTVAIEPVTPSPTIEEFRCASILQSLCNNTSKFSGADELEVSPQPNQFHFDSEPENDDSMSDDSDYTLLDQTHIRIRKRRNSTAKEGGNDHPLMKYDTEAMERHLKDQIDLEALRTALSIANLKYSKPSGWEPVQLQLAVKPSKRPYFDAECYCEEDGAEELNPEDEGDLGDRLVGDDANAPSSASIQSTGSSHYEDSDVGHVGRVDSELVDASGASKVSYKSIPPDHRF
jgi:hypothetical protein